MKSLDVALILTIYQGHNDEKVQILIVAVALQISKFYFN